MTKVINMISKSAGFFLPLMSAIKSYTSRLSNGLFTEQTHQPLQSAKKNHQPKQALD